MVAVYEQLDDKGKEIFDQVCHGEAWSCACSCSRLELDNMQGSPASVASICL